jgi:hypothetical protein
MVHRHVYGVLLLDGILYRAILYIVILLYTVILLVYQVMDMGVSITHHYVDANTTHGYAIRHTMLNSHVGLF